ncbi:MAG: ATP synthase F1 subunit delta [Vicinamibacteria bacterium]|nr:ATP synthase F1 subunit delta [Vicinamibacteria bacterium]
MNDSQSARRYAHAIIETATETRAVRDELAAISGTLNATPALLEALSNPGVPSANKKAVVTAIFQGLSSPLPRLMDMLIDASRVELIHEIAHRYRDEWNAKNNVHAARVTAALELDDDARDRVRRAIEKAVSGSVEMEITTDPSLVGGLKVEVDGHLFDGTVKARLKALRQHLL